MRPRSIVCRIIFAAAILFSGMAAEGKFIEVERIDGTFDYLYVSRSQNGCFYVRSHPEIIPLTSGSSLIEVFDAKAEPDPKTASNPIWSTEIPGWSKLFVGNDGDTVIAIKNPNVVAQSTSKITSPRGIRRNGVVVVTNRDPSEIAHKSFRIPALTGRLVRRFQGVLVGGDAIAPSDSRATYGWYRKSPRRGDTLVLRGYGRKTVFDLSSGRRLR